MEKLYDYILQKESHLGLMRAKNEDRVIALVHPEEEQIKLLAVADGMGGKEHGDIAADYVIQKFGYWFLQQSKTFFSDLLKLKEELLNLVTSCNQHLISTYGSGNVGTTLTLALVLLEDTIVLHLGDSRCYFYKNGEIRQMSEDDSDVWLYYQYHYVKKVWLRYFSTSNVIHNCIGISYEICRPHIYIYANSSYQTLLLTTDGITDLITDSKLQRILREENIYNVSKRIIYEAVFVNQNLFVPDELRKCHFDRYIVPVKGRDNASIVLFSKFNF